jgi:hypothetical protein
MNEIFDDWSRSLMNEKIIDDIDIVEWIKVLLLVSLSNYLKKLVKANNLDSKLPLLENKSIIENTY